MSPFADRTAPSLDEIEAIALDALDTLPAPFAEPARAVQLRVAEVADDLGLDRGRSG